MRILWLVVSLIVSLSSAALAGGASKVGASFYELGRRRYRQASRA
jgi:hypothetical protein